MYLKRLDFRIETEENNLARLRQQANLYFDVFLEAGAFLPMMEFYGTLWMNTIRKMEKKTEDLMDLNGKLKDLKVNAIFFSLPAKFIVKRRRSITI